METTVRTPIASKSEDKTAPAVQEEHGQVDTTLSEPLNTSPSERTVAGQAPLIVDIAEIGAGYGTLNTEYLAKKIDGYILEEMKLNNIKDTDKGYKEVADAWLKVLKLSPEMDIYTRLEKLKEYGYLNSELREKMDDRENLLQGDPLRMTSTQLRKLIENGNSTR